MAVTSEYGPNELAANTAYGVTMGEPVRTSANWPVGSTLIDRTNGLMNGVFAYGGATLFNELMAEMRRPWVSPDQESLHNADLLQDGLLEGICLRRDLYLRCLRDHGNGCLHLPGTVHFQPCLPR